MAAGGNQQPATNESMAPAPTTLPNDEYPDGEASAAAQIEDPWSNIIGSWIHDTAVSAAMSWSAQTMGCGIWYLSPVSFIP